VDSEALVAQLLAPADPEDRVDLGGLLTAIRRRFPHGGILVDGAGQILMRPARGSPATGTVWDFHDEDARLLMVQAWPRSTPPPACTQLEDEGSALLILPLGGGCRLVCCEPTGSLVRWEQAAEDGGVGLWTYRCDRSGRGGLFTLSHLAAWLHSMEQTTDAPRTWLRSLRRSDRRAIFAALRQAYRGDRRFVVDYRVERGPLRWLRCHGRVELTAGGSLCAASGSVTDITAQQRTTRSSRPSTGFMPVVRDRTQRRLLAMVEALPDALLLVDREGILLEQHLSPELERDLVQAAGRRPVHGDRLPGLLPRQIADYALDQVRLTASNGGFQTIDYSVVDQGMMRYRQVRLVGTGSEAVLLIISDITERKQIELMLASARRDAQAADRAKSAFLAHMSHDIRTPMATALGMIELLMREQLTDRQREFVELAYHSSRNQLRLLDDILDLSRTRLADEGRLAEVPVVLNDLVREIHRTMTYQAQSKGLGFRLLMDEEGSELVLVDAVRIRQVLYNLTGNAIKYTDEGHVTIEVDCMAAGDELDVVLSVVDTGPGIHAGEVQSLFEPFTRRSGAMAQKVAGFGLGLSICNQLAECMGATLSVESRPGKGSRFSLALRARLCPPGMAPEAKTSNEPIELEGRRVLVAEDDPSIQRMMQFLLGGMGAEVVIARNGEEALTMGRSTRFDLILMDCNMPHLDGRDVTRELRLEGRSSRTPIVALTALSSEDDRAACRQVGMDDVLIKPFSRNELLDCLRPLVKRRGKRRRRAPSSISNRLEPSARALLLDQNAVLQTCELAGDEHRGLSMVRQLVEDLQVDWNGGMEELRHAIEQNDAEELEPLAHRLKARSAMLGLAALRTLAAELEQEARGEEGVRWHEIHSLWNRIERTIPDSLDAAYRWLEQRSMGRV
jgi:signal transduction histidine kinase/CheY-like chemotaxis protein